MCYTYKLIDGNRLSIAMDSEKPQKLNAYAKCNHRYLIGKFPESERRRRDMKPHHINWKTGQ